MLCLILKTQITSLTVNFFNTILLTVNLDLENIIGSENFLYIAIVKSFAHLYFNMFPKQYTNLVNAGSKVLINESIRKFSN